MQPTRTYKAAIALCSLLLIIGSSPDYAGAVQSVVPIATPQDAATPPGVNVTVPGGTSISVVVSGQISSATANVGDTFDIAAAADVAVDGWIVIKKDAPGQGEILAVDRAGSHGHPGSLGVQMDWIYGVDGHKIRLTSQRKTEEGQGEAGAASTATILSYVLLGPLGLFAHNFVKGHDVVVDSSHPLPAYVDDSVFVVATVRADVDSGFAPSADNSANGKPTGASVTATSQPLASSTIPKQTAATPTRPVAPPVASPASLPASAAQPKQDATPVAQTNTSSTDQSASLLDFEGTEPKTSPSFTTIGNWSLQYTFDCSAAPKGSPTGFAVIVNGASSPIPPIIHGGDVGTDVISEHELGTFTLNVQSHCVWHIHAFGSQPSQSGPK